MAAAAPLRGAQPPQGPVTGRAPASGPGLIRQTQEGLEKLETMDNWFKFWDTLFNFGEAVAHTYHWAPGAQIKALRTGINGARKFIETARIVPDVDKATAAISGRGEKVRPGYERAADAVRHTTWFCGHTSTTINLMNTLGVVSYGSAGAVIGQLAPGFALVGFACNIMMNCIELYHLSEELAAGVTDERRQQIEARQQQRIIDVVKDLLVWMGLFGATFLAWKFDKKWHISRPVALGMQLVAAGLGFIRIYDKVKEDMEKKAKAAKAEAAAARPAPAIAAPMQTLVDSGTGLGQGRPSAVSNASNWN